MPPSCNATAGVAADAAIDGSGKRGRRRRMIEKPPLLTIHTPDRRVTKAQIAALSDAPTGFVVDALGGVGALPSEIAPLAPGVLPKRLVGPALTCHPGPRDIMATLAALTEIQAGDVLVIATGGWRGCAAIGDRVAGMAKNCGAVGVVTDGMMRDYEGLMAVGIPLYCAGLSPNSPYENGPGSVGLPVTLGAVAIASGDMIVADRDGVVVVPFERIDEVIDSVRRVRGLEEELDAKVANGLAVPDATRELVASDRVKRV
jgi:4-hydroxy-4-methyl-2-oxoglutarate aldolase